MSEDTIILSQKETADLLGVSERTLARWHSLRKGPPRVSAGRRPLYRLQAVQKWLERNEIQPITTFSGIKYSNG